MSANLVFWTAADGAYVPMAQAMVSSARDVGVTAPFHVFSNVPVRYASTHRFGALNKGLMMFKLQLLRDLAATVRADWFCWLDADNYFLRRPDALLTAAGPDRLHVHLECDLTRPGLRFPDWWGIPLATYAALIRERIPGATGAWNCNGGFFLVHRDLVPQFVATALSFWWGCDANGFRVPEEVALAFAGQALVEEPRHHAAAYASGLWASDWSGVFADQLPDGRVWCVEDYFSGDRRRAAPCIVHAMRSKSALAKAGATQNPNHDQRYALCS